MNLLPDYKELDQLRAEVSRLTAELAEARRDANCWLFYVKNPYRATDLILATVNVNAPACWAKQCYEALAATQKGGA